MKEITCCFTGHRDIPYSDLTDLKERLKKELVILIELGYKNFVAGGAIGFDTLAAEAVLDLKSEYSDIKLHLVLPCEGQDKFWTSEQKKKYKAVLSVADSHEYVSIPYTRYCMHQRNRKMVDMSSAVICFFDGGEKGGTASTVKYALKKGIKTVNIYTNPKETD
ncbi:MAG: DUF1273 domain-containing protein [Ruminococcaceae bacterium]|nr:DUF1273 domain-containing protein [Oscillospiraceae bacterium]